MNERGAKRQARDGSEQLSEARERERSGEMAQDFRDPRVCRQRSWKMKNT